MISIDDRQPSGAMVAGDLHISNAPKRSWWERTKLVLARGHAERRLNAFLRATRDADAQQQRVLFEKIRRNAGSAFGQEFGFREIRSYRDFVRQVPILRYEDLTPYIERVKAGELGAMFGSGQRVHMFAKTSGTTDRPKYVPVTDAFLREYRNGWSAFGLKVITDHPGCFLRPIVQVTSPMDEEYSSGGYPCGAITGLMAATQQRLVRQYYVAPREVAHVTDATARYYCVMRFSIPTDVAFIITASPATQLRLARIADRHAEDLIRDVRDGVVSAKMDVPAPLRRAFEARLQPDPLSAKRLEQIAGRTGRLLPKDYWNLGFLANWTGGTMGLYLRDFPEYFGSTPVRDIGLLASEGRMSIPVEDHTPSGVLNVTDNFYEFIPADQYESANPTVLRSNELKVGQEYFILLTTSAGFYRYDIGDRVRVTGFFGTAPLIEFLHKGVHTSSLTGEKLTEQQVVMAFDEVAGGFSLAGRTFVLAPYWGETPGYRLHLDRGDVANHDPLALAQAFDKALQGINIEYASKRSSGRLRAVELNLLPPNWLAETQQAQALQQRASNEQFKPRYLLSDVDADAGFPRPAAKMAATTALDQQDRLGLT